MNLTKRITRRIFLSDTKMAVLLQHAEFFMNPKSIYIFGRIAVLKPYRGTGLGSLLLTEAQSYVTAKNAQKSAFLRRCAPQAFYETLGFVRRVKNTLRKTARIFIWKKRCNFYTIFIPI